MKARTKKIFLTIIFVLVAVNLAIIGNNATKNPNTIHEKAAKKQKNVKISAKAKLPSQITEPLMADTVYKRNEPVEHIFFHPLVAYPEKAFDGDNIAKGMDDYMATTTEFQRMLEELYENDYILVDIEKIYERVLDEASNKYIVRRAEFMIPAGKKPFIIS